MKAAICFIFVALLAITLAAYSQGEENCPKFCNHMFKPVCGKNSTGAVQTFSNECKLRAKNCYKRLDFEIIHTGPCNAEEKEEALKEQLKAEEDSESTTTESITEVTK